MQEKDFEGEKDFGIPDEGEMKIERIEASVSHDADTYDEKHEPMDQSKPVKPRRSRNHQSPPRIESKLTPLLTALAVEIEETIDLLILARTPDGGPVQKIDILCRKVSASLLKMEDIRDKIAAEMMGG